MSRGRVSPEFRQKLRDSVNIIDVIGEHVVLLSTQTPDVSQVIEWFKKRGAKPAQILADWHVALDARGLAAFVAAFPELRYEVRPPTLDDLFLALSTEATV